MVQIDVLLDVLLERGPPEAVEQSNIGLVDQREKSNV